MPAELPSLTFKTAELPDWRTEYQPELGIHIIVDNKTGKRIMAVHADDMATLVMALPRLLKFLALFKINHPCRIPIDQVMSACKINIIREGEEDAKPRAEQMAD